MSAWQKYQIYSGSANQIKRKNKVVARDYHVSHLAVKHLVASLLVASLLVGSLLVGSLLVIPYLVAKPHVARLKTVPTLTCSSIAACVVDLSVGGWWTVVAYSSGIL